METTEQENIDNAIAQAIANANETASKNNKKNYLISRTENACSYEFGKASSRFKIYFEDAQDLKKRIDELIALGLYTIEDFKA